MSSATRCPACGHGRFLVVPDVAIALQRRVQHMGFERYERASAYAQVRMVICGSCSRAE